MWTLPLWGAIVALSFWFVELVPDSPIPPPAISGWVFFVVGSLALLASLDIARAAPDTQNAPPPRTT